MNTNEDTKEIQAALRKIGMRLTDGPGWFVTVVVDGKAVRVWADEVIDQ